MLIKVFGIWLMAMHITSLHSDPWGDLGYHTKPGDCYIQLRSNDPQIIRGHTCDEVAEEINRQMERVQ